MFKQQVHDGVSKKDDPDHGGQDNESDHAKAESHRVPQFIHGPASRLVRQGGQDRRGQGHAENAQWKLDQAHAVKTGTWARRGNTTPGSCSR